jgi:sarcosine oxidase, subunit gamma
MPDAPDHGIQLIRDRTLVSVRVTPSVAGIAAARLGLAAPLSIAAGEPESLAIGPGHWLLLSHGSTADEIIGRTGRALDGFLHSVVDRSSAQMMIRLRGPLARELLARGSAVDFRPSAFPPGSCCRTRFAGQPVVVLARSAGVFELLVDRCLAHYFEDWLAGSAEIAAGTAVPCSQSLKPPS